MWRGRWESLRVKIDAFGCFTDRACVFDHRCFILIKHAKLLRQELGLKLKLSGIGAVTELPIIWPGAGLMRSLLAIQGTLKLVPPCASRGAIRHKILGPKTKAKAASSLICRTGQEGGRRRLCLSSFTVRPDRYLLLDPWSSTWSVYKRDRVPPARGTAAVIEALPRVLAHSAHSGVVWSR